MYWHSTWVSISTFRCGDKNADIGWITARKDGPALCALFCAHARWCNGNKGWVEYGHVMDDLRRRTADDLLAEIELEERRSQRGQLKMFLGYAGGVGKSYQMLDEGRRRCMRGEDVVACALQQEYAPEVRGIITCLEVVPTLRVGEAEVIDVDAVIQRRPEVALVDGLAYDNPPGSPYPHRWQEVEQLLAAGITVLTTVNLQYLESLQDEIERITGHRGQQVVPWTFIEKSVDEIAVVDAPSEEGLSTADEGAPARLALKHRLSRLRELALLVAAAVVDRQLVKYLRSHGTEQAWGVLERILVCVPADGDAEEMLKSGRRNADRFQGEFYAVYLTEDADSRTKAQMLQRNIQQARRLGAEVCGLHGGDRAQRVLRFAREHSITQIFVARGSQTTGAWGRFKADTATRLIRAAEEIDVVVYPS